MQLGLRSSASDDAGFVDLRLSPAGHHHRLAVLDLVAAVGMWLTSSWGMAVWLRGADIEAVLPFLMPDLDVEPLGDTLMPRGAGRCSTWRWSGAPRMRNTPTGLFRA
jgi:hypothetical protein